MSASIPALVGPDGSTPLRASPGRRGMQASLSPGAEGAAFPYEAANPFGQEMGGWLPWIRSPDGELDTFRDRMVARSRDLVRNDGWAAGGIDRTLDNVVGAQFRLSAKPDWRALSRFDKAYDETWANEFRTAAEAEWRMWAEDVNRWCDGTGVQTFAQMMHLALRHKLIDGAALGVLLWEPGNVGVGAARYATALQMIDPDRLCNPYEAVDTASIRGGVEVDRGGRPIAYHIRRAEPYDWYLAVESMEWDRVVRQTPWGRPVVVHDFDRLRADQNNGITVFAPVMARFKMLANYDRAEVQAALLQTIFSFFISSPYDPEDMRNALDAGGEEDRLRFYEGLRSQWHKGNPITAGGARIPELFPGEKIETVNASRPHSNFEAFEHAVLRNIAAATGNSAEQISLDYSKTNYSSARAALIEMWKTMSRRRGDFTAGFPTPIYAGWLEEAVETRLQDVMPANAAPFAEYRTAYSRSRWIGPGRGWVDPLKERAGAVLGLDAGFSTLEQECAEQGMDWEENLDQRAREIDAMKKRGLPMPDWAGGSGPLASKTERPE